MDGPPEVEQDSSASKSPPAARAQLATAAWEALIACPSDDAAALCAGFLDAMQTAGPPMGDPFGMLVGDARLWADVAPVHEVAAYGAAAMDRLCGSALGLNTRKRLFMALWTGLPPKERRAFLDRVTGKAGQ